MIISPVGVTAKTPIVRKEEPVASDEKIQSIKKKLEKIVGRPIQDVVIQLTKGEDGEVKVEVLVLVSSANGQEAIPLSQFLSKESETGDVSLLNDLLKEMKGLAEDASEEGTETSSGESGGGSGGESDIFVMSSYQNSHQNSQVYWHLFSMVLEAQSRIFDAILSIGEVSEEERAYEEKLMWQRLEEKRLDRDRDFRKFLDKLYQIKLTEADGMRVKALKEKLRGEEITHFSQMNVAVSHVALSKARENILRGEVSLPQSPQKASLTMELAMQRSEAFREWGKAEEERRIATRDKGIKEISKWRPM